MNFASLWQTIRKISHALSADKAILLFACLILLLIAVLWQCAKPTPKTTVSPIIIIKPQKYDSLSQQKLNKIDSLVDANHSHIKQLQGERLQSYIDSVFNQ